VQDDEFDRADQADFAPDVRFLSAARGNAMTVFFSYPAAAHRAARGKHLVGREGGWQWIG
jgi:hypothetical protein